VRPRPDPLPALAGLFADGSADARLFTLPGGAALFETGERSDKLFLVHSGRLGAVAGERLLGVIRPGEPVGEMALLADRPHSASVVALRDSEVLALDRPAFFTAASERPDVMLELSRLLIARAAVGETSRPAAEPSVFALIGWTAPARHLAEQVADALRAEGAAVAVIGAERAGERPPGSRTWKPRKDYVLSSPTRRGGLGARLRAPSRPHLPAGRGRARLARPGSRLRRPGRRRAESRSTCSCSPTIAPGAPSPGSTPCPAPARCTSGAGPPPTSPASPAC
jgi:hypothetical protein